ncbi:MAG: hypothetical protein J2P28_21580, partial [Actinobacteria bacterium]|nr:hypothetical protein [Actinomycetota bacterium]
MRAYRTRTTAVLKSSRRPVTIALGSILLIAGAVGPAAASSAASAAGKLATPPASLAYSHLVLPGNQWAAVYSDGLAEVHHNGQTKVVNLPRPGSDATTATLPDRSTIVLDLLHSGAASFAAQQVVVVYGSGVTASTGRTAHTNVDSLNQALSGLGVDQTDKLFTGVPQSKLDGMRSTAEQQLGRSLLDFGHA